MYKSIFATVESFVGYPPIKQLIAHLKKSNHIYCVQNDVKQFENFFKTYGIQQDIIFNFATAKEYNSQTIYLKLTRYLRLFFYLAKQRFKWRNDEITIYTIDLFALAISILMKSKRHKVVYLQYEIIEPKHLNTLDTFLFKKIRSYSQKIDLIITPEENRSGFLMKLFHNSKIESVFTLPNTNNNNVDLKVASLRNSNRRIVITHVGAVGLNHHIKSFLTAIYNLDADKYEIRFIGILTQDVIELIESYNCSFIKIIGQVKHSQLERYYLETDIGVILYKDVSLNHRFCAPNKLYEYWSYGIPVIGDNLPGLRSVFTDLYLGKLIEMKEPGNIINAIEQFKTGVEEKYRVQGYFYDHFKLDNYLSQLDKKLKNN